jgi:pyruvate/2-oxoglutarate dehydrogenase complex dihydrolipoamide acyltransferase (E2) component
MKHTVLLGPREGVGIVAAHAKTLGEYVAPGETLVTVRIDGVEEPVLADRHGVVFRWMVLPGDAIEAGEPLVVLTGTTEVPPALPPLPDPDAVARHHATSWRLAPHVSTVAAARLGEVARLAESAGCTLLPFVVASVAAALRAHPRFNVGNEVRLGVGDSVLVDADRRSVLQLARALETGEPGERASFTITDLSASGALLQNPILRQPQVGHLAVGAPDGGRVYLTLVHDARAATEAEAAAFLCAIRSHIESADFLFV